MDTTVRIPAEGNLFAVRFPNRCVYCGNPAEVGVPVVVEKSDAKDGQQVKSQVILNAPYCRLHQKIDSRNSIIFGLLVIPSGIALFVAGLLFAYPEPPFRTTGLLALIMVILVGVGFAWIGGMIIAFLVAFVLFPILTALTKSPFKMNLGMSAAYSPGDSCLNFVFPDENVAASFKDLNSIFRDDSETSPQDEMHCPLCEVAWEGKGCSIIEAGLAGTGSDVLQVSCFACGERVKREDFIATREDPS